MPILINIVLALLPSVVILLWAYRRDSRKAEQPRLVARAFVLGFAAAVLALIVGLLLSPAGALLPFPLNLLYHAFVVAAFVEEGAKLAIVLLLILPQPDFDEVADGLVYTMAAGLGFAFIENALYSGSTLVLLIRAVSAVPLHAIAGGVMGFYVGRSKFSGDREAHVGLLAAIAVHGTYDALVFAGSWFLIAAGLVLIAGGLWVRRLFTAAVELDALANRHRRMPHSSLPGLDG